uniref:PSI domain-containing protein n=1 Tax=Soboliphyme baturini TaxID=241478 RepID=A0A183ITC0_9BILA
LSNSIGIIHLRSGVAAWSVCIDNSLGLNNNQRRISSAATLPPFIAISGFLPPNVAFLAPGIIFSPSQLAISWERGCYKISGPLQVEDHIKGPIQIYTETKMSVQGEPMRCIGADVRTNCGGHGSCIYCDLCHSKNSHTELSLAINGHPLNCQQGLRPGRYDNAQWKFCSPTHQDYIAFSQLDAICINNILCRQRQFTKWSRSSTTASLTNHH